MIIDEAYCLSDNTIYTPDELAKKLSTVRGLNRDYYLKYLTCPYCKVVNCEYVYKRKASYFDLNDEQEHRHGCIYSMEEYSQEKIKDDIKKKKYYAVERTIQAIFDNYCNSPTDIPKSTKVTSLKRIPQRRIDLPLRVDDFYKYKVFYGKVIVQPHFTQNDKYYLLRSVKDNTVLCKITVTDTLYKFLPIEYRLVSNEPRFVCFFGYFKRALTDKPHTEKDEIQKEEYRTIGLINSSFIKMEL